MTRHREVRAFLAEHVPADVDVRALERITAHDQELDESYRWVSVTLLLRELGEEPLDTIAWAALLSVRVHGSRGRALLAAICQRAAEADRLVLELARLLEHDGTANLTHNDGRPA